MSSNKQRKTVCYNSLKDKQRHGGSIPSLLWFQLLHSADGQPYNETTVLLSSVSPTSQYFIVDQFCKAVKAKFANSVLHGVPPASLVVYKNMANFEAKKDPLAIDLSLLYSKLGKSQNDPLVVVVVVPSSKSKTESITTNAKRKIRWDNLNTVLRTIRKKTKCYDSTEYLTVSWNQVQDIFKPIKYNQNRKDIENDDIDFLEKYLTYATTCLTSLTNIEAQRQHLISPILVCVSILFAGNVTILLKEDFIGNIVQARCHFEFILRRGRNVVCIVEAKKGNFEQAIAEALIGCEIIAEREDLDIVYGIVTNYSQWTFLRSTNEMVEKDTCGLSYTLNGPEKSSLKMIAEKIYGMLSNE